jgi:signal transduction histidine kinase
VKGDPDRLRQLLINLMTNAVKYTPEGGEIKLSLLRSPRWVEVMVADTGSGIPAEDLPFIFDRFYRVHKARSRQDGGTGLGLSIAKWIAEAHKGTLTVQSTLNVGTTFTLRLPLPEMPAGGSSSPDAITRPHLPVLRLIRPRPEEETPAGHHDPAGPEQIES